MQTTKKFKLIINYPECFEMIFIESTAKKKKIFFHFLTHVFLQKRKMMREKVTERGKGKRMKMMHNKLIRDE